MPAVHSVSVCKIESDIIYGVESNCRFRSKFYHHINEDQIEISRSEVYRGEQTVYILSEEEMYLFLVDFM